MSHASWSPVYELRASSGTAGGAGTEPNKDTVGELPSPRVILHYAASVKQETGEDWTQARVSVSTAAPGRWPHIPRVRHMHVAPGSSFQFAGSVGAKPALPIQVVQMQQMVQQQQQRAPNTTAVTGLSGKPNAQAAASVPPASSLFGSARPQRPSGPTVPGSEDNNEWTTIGDATDDVVRSDIDNAEPTSEWSATRIVVRASAVASTFHVEHACTIPSGTTPHCLAIAAIPFSAEVGYVVVPRTAPEAFVEVCAT